MTKRACFFPVVFFLLCSFLYSQETLTINTDQLPQIPYLKSKDPVFKEYTHIVEDNYKELAAKRKPDMLFFVHTITEEDKALLSGHDSQLVAISSRCNISYDTIATLNGIESSTDNLMGKTIIIPTVSGLFIKMNVNSDSNALEIMLHESYADRDLTNSDYYYNINGQDYLFIVNLRFTPTQRAYFTDASLGLPLEKDSFWISSEFGKRKNPVDGKWKNHNGIDFAAPEGTPVYAVKDGYAAYCIKNDETFGNYVILTHDTGKMTSVYAHLSSFCVNQYDFVKKGAIIGYVGHTGMATGSHLHFEIRQGGVAQDPKAKLNIK